MKVQQTVHQKKEVVPRKKSSDIQNSDKNTENNRTIIGSYRLKESNGKYTLSVVVPLSWLLSADRVYPVTIDPTASNTYASGNIASCYYPTFNSVNMDVTIPAGSTVTATNSQCTYIAVSPSKRNDGWIGFQSGSNLDGYWYCNTNSAGTCNVTGTSNSTIANGTYSSGTVPFTLKVSRDNPSGSCNTTYLYVSNSTWTETVTYCTVPGSPTLTSPSNNASVQPGKTIHFTWNAPTTGDTAFTYTFYFYNGSSWQNWSAGSNTYFDLQLSEYNSSTWCGTSTQWYVKATNSCGNTNSSTWNLVPYPKYSGSAADYTITPTSNCQSSGAHSIVQGGADYYSFNATAGNIYYFSTCSTDLGCGTSTGWDTYLKIYGTNGSCTTSAYNDDGGACIHKESFINGWTCTTSGTYYLQLTGYNSSAHGTYYLEYKYCTPSNAPTLAFPADNANIQPGKVTHFTWNTPTTGSAPFTYIFYLYNGTSWSNWNCDTNRYIDLQLLEYNSASWCGTNAQWYVKVTNSCGNDSSATRNLIPYPKYSGSTADYTITPTSNCQSSGAHSIIQGGADYYSFNATAGITYYFSTCSTDLGCGTSTGWDTYLKIYGTDGICTTSAYNDDGGACTNNESFINGWTCSTTGTYYVQITGYNSSAYGTYYLQYNGTCPTLTANLTGGSSPVCYNTAPSMFTTTGSGGSGTYTYLWYLNGSSTGITTQTYTAPALTSNATIYCAVSSCGQTVNTTTYEITVNPLPIAEAGNDTTITVGDSIQIGSNPVSGYTYLWSPVTGLSSSTVANPVAIPASTITYYLTVTDVNSCVAWDSISIIVLPPALTTKLINSDCGATGINFDQTLTAFEVQGANFYLFHIINSSLNFSEQIIKTGNTFNLLELNTQIYFNTTYKIAVSVIIGTDTIAPVDTCFITTFDPDQDYHNNINQVIYDRFGNTYTLDEITRKPDDPNSFSVIAGRFWLDFTDPVIYTPQVVATITQVFDDLDVLITSQSCGTNLPDDLPYVYIQINAPTGMDPGNPGAAISSSFYAPLLQACCNPSIENSGVLESEVWRAINTGINNPVLFDGVINLNFFSPNWTFNTDLFTQTTANPPQIDLYTVVLHETMHLLGFASLISSTGTSILAPNNMYSRYDLFLNDNTGLNFINWTTPYTTLFNVPVSSLNANCLNIRFQGTNTFDEPITNINNGALSHIDDGCLTPPITEPMTPGLSPGEEKRSISPRDANILLDLGYQLSGNFGDGSFIFHVNGLPSGGPGVIGRPDGLNGFNANCANNYQLELCNPGTDQIVINDISPNTFLTNDIHAVGFEGLELLQGNATFVENHTTNQITVTPNASGLITFRYVPIDVMGNRGNYTCIYINVISCQNCLHPDPCNLVCNPSMECVDPPCYLGGALPQNWMSSHGSPDWDNLAIIAPPDPGYLRMGTTTDIWNSNFSEGVMTTLSQSTILNHTYIFSFYRRRFADYSYSNIIDQVFVKLFSSANTVGIIPTILHEAPIVPIIPGTSQLILEEDNIVNTDWVQVVICFTADGIYDRLWIYPHTQVVGNHGLLYIDRVQLAPFNPNFAGADVTSACANNVTIGTDMCSVDNMQFEWTQIGVPGVIGNTEQIQVPGDVTPTPTYQLEFVPLLPNPNTVVFPVGGNLCQTTDQVNVNFTAGMSVNTTINNTSCNICNGSATVAPFNGIPPYQYLWDAQAGGGTTFIATNLCAGNYQVTITDYNACTLIQNIVILQQMTLTVTSVNPSCNGGSNGSATVTPGCGTSPYTYSWNTTPVQTTATAIDLTAGTWQVTVTDANGISVSAAVTLATSAVTAIPSHTNVSCNGGSNGSATVTSSGGTSPYTYSWNTTPVQTTATATALTAGTWNVTVTDANLCTATASVTITQPVITISLTTTQTNVSCNGDGGTGSATVTATGGTPNYSYDWSPNNFTGDGTVTYSGLIAGVYSVTVTDANNGCATVNVTITQPAAVLTSSISSQTNVSCNGYTNGSATVTATGGTLNYFYDWSPNSYTGDGTDTYSGLIAGVYDVTVTDANNCTATSTVTITEPALPTVNAGVDQSVCTGTAVALSGSGATSYIWDNGVTDGVPFTPLTTLSYTVTGTDVNGCTNTDVVLVTVNTLPIVNAGADQSTCSGTSVTLSGSGASSYVWDNGITDGVSFTPLTTTTYTVTGTDANGCSNTDQVIVTVNSLPTPVITGSLSYCTGSSTTLDAGAGYTTYYWSTGAATQTINATTVDNPITVTVTDANNCTATSTVTITEPAALTATTTPTDITCNGGSTGIATVTATGGTTPYSYDWSPNNFIGDGTDTYSGLIAGVYYVTVTDANYCTWVGNATVIEDIINANWPVVIPNTSGDEQIYDMAYDEQGNIYAIGLFNDNITLGNTSYTSPYPDANIFVAKYDYCGNFINGHVYGTMVSVIAGPWDCHIEYMQSTGKVVVAGQFTLIDFTGGSNPMYTPVGDGGGVFLAYLDPTSLYCTVTQQISLNSTAIDYVKGLSVNGSSAVIAGVFSGGTLNISIDNTIIGTITGNNPSHRDLYIARFDLASGNPSLFWGTGYNPNTFNDQGMAIEYVTSTDIYLTYSNTQSFIVQINASDGSGVAEEQIGYPGEYFEINDIASYNSKLYLCGFKLTTSNCAAVISYTLPNITWGSATNVISTPLSGNDKNTANKIVANNNGVYVAGTFGQNLFSLDPTYTVTPLTLYGSANHFVTKFDASLGCVWQTGVVNSSISRATSLVYDSQRNMYYIGGSFDGTLSLIHQGLYTGTSPGNDAFMARFEDLGEAWYKDLQIQNSFVINDSLYSNLKVYPNPNKGIFNVLVSNSEIIEKIEITDMLGRIVYINENINSLSDVIIDINGLSDNSYILSVTSDVSVYTTKIVLIKQ